MTSDSNPNNDEFDLIIIGAGTAGSLLASRLSSSPSLQILVLEAGHNHNADPNVKTPGLSGSLLNNPKYDWPFQTQPEEGLNGRVIKQPRGKLWGGSSAINSHALVFPSRGYHDAWGSLLGGEGKGDWSWSGVGRYYRKFQRLQKPSEKVTEKLGVEGFKPAEEGGEGESGGIGIHASFPTEVHILQKAWKQAITDFGFESKNDPVEGNVLGGATTSNAVDSIKGERSHAGIAFLEPAERRENIEVRSGVLVRKIVFDDEKDSDGKLVATGVMYIDEEGGEVMVKARSEVVVCAGTFGSPKILEFSGIGQRERLVAAGIECLHDLPGVGENLQDHLNFGPSVEVLDSIQTGDTRARNPALAEAAKKLYESKREGPLAGGGAWSFSYLPLQASQSSSQNQELTTLINDTLDKPQSTTSKGLKAQYDIIKHMLEDPSEATSTVFMTRKQRYTPPSEPAPGNYMCIIAMLSYPFSRGSSHITSTDPNVPLEIKFNYLTHPLDVEILSRHVLQINQLLSLPALSVHLKPDGNTLPYGFPRDAKNVEEVEEYVRKFAATNYHPLGTCAMMSEELGGVVGEDLRVYGTSNVRVVDASVVPIEPRGNVLSTVYAVAEKGADILKDSLKL